MIWDLAPNAAFGMKRIYYYGIPTGTIAFWGAHVLHILRVDYTFKSNNEEMMIVLFK